MPDVPNETIVVRAPLRIPLGGGGTDLPSYWKGRGGFFVSGAIDKYVTVTLTRDITGTPMGDFEKSILDLLGVHDWNVTWTSDVTPGSGLGFSSALTVAIVAAVLPHKPIPYLVAQKAYQIERELSPVGCQDHYAASLGGVVMCKISPTGIVDAYQILPKASSRKWLNWFTLYDTGIRRSAASVLKDQDAKAIAGDDNVLTCLKEIEAIGHESFKAMKRDDWEYYAALTTRHWKIKQRMSPNVTNARIDELYCNTTGMAAGKLIGAGGGGCFLFVNRPGQEVISPDMQRIDFNWGKGVHRVE